MSQYYYFVAGLPSLSSEDTKPVYSVARFKAELETVLTNQDKRIMRWYYMKYDNRNIISFLRKKTSDDNFDDRGNFSKEVIETLCSLPKEDEDEKGRIPKDTYVPAYIKKITKDYFSRIANEEAIDFHLLEDQLSAAYYKEAMKCGNNFLASWFELNLNIRNVLSTVNCRKYGLEKQNYLVGDNSVAEHLRQMRGREFQFDDSIEYMKDLIHIAEDKDPMTREKRLDALRWKWLDEQTFFTTFDIENLIAYMLRLEMTERWVMLDKLRGEKTFRQLVADMKQESADTLEEFKENNK